MATSRLFGEGLQAVSQCGGWNPTCKSRSDRRGKEITEGPQVSCPGPGPTAAGPVPQPPCSRTSPERIQHLLGVPGCLQSCIQLYYGLGELLRLVGGIMCDLSELKYPVVQARV